MDISDIFTGIVLLLQVAIILFGKYMLPDYLAEKAKNLATKQDIAEITREVELVKVDLNKLDRVNEKKYTIKYDACMTMFGIIDSVLSHAMKTDYDGKEITVNKQSLASPSVVRQCHNELLITIDNSEIIELFMNLVTGQFQFGDREPTDVLYQIRILVRKELGFGNMTHNYNSYSWLTYTGDEEKNETS